MKTRDVIIGFVVLVVLVAGVLYVKNSKKKTSNPVSTSNYKQVESKFPGLSLPSNADRANLDNVSGGEGLGEAIRTFENGKFHLTIVADLPDPKAGYFYQGWLVKGNPGDSGFSYVSTGKLVVGKGGYISEFSAAKDHSDYKKVLVTEEKIFNNTPEIHILEGSF